jgi:hypothetical protein
MDRAAPPSQAEIEAVVRAYLSRIARRYLPVLAGVVALLLIVIFVPTASPSGQQQQAGAGTTAGTTADPGAAGSAGTRSGAAAVGTTPSAGGAAATGVTGSGPGTTNSGGGAVPAGPVAPSKAGVARSGVHCRAGARQVTWSVYAPPCVAKYTGNNGGATSRGVTGSTITLSYRVSTSADDAAISAATGSAAPPKDSAFVQDLQTYINYFNTQFELYGRKVVLKTFNGQGDYIQEDQGQGADRAQADAATAHSLGAFGDATFQLRGSNPYWSSLAQQGIVAWGPLGFPSSYYEKYAPYWYSYTPSGTSVAAWMGDLTCRRMAGMNAIFAPDTTYKHTVRKFGLVHPDNPEYVAVANELKAQLKGCGVGITREATYSINVAQYQTEATNVVAQMRAKGVTTVLCYCDPVVPIFLGNAAQAQRYHPEWVQPYWGDAQARQPQSGNWGGLIASGGTWPAQSQNEAYTVYKAASHGGEPHEKYFAAAYAELMQIYMGLQAAGPTLTPQNLQRGYQSLPPTGTGQAGKWRFTGAHQFTPQSFGMVGWYDPHHRSNFDGANGGYVSCDSGQLFPFDNPDAWGGPRKQMHCFGQ